MAIWQDQTIKVTVPGHLEIAPDGDIHVTWVEGGVSFTLIVPLAEAERLAAAREHLAAERAAVPVEGPA